MELVSAPHETPKEMEKNVDTDTCFDTVLSPEVGLCFAVEALWVNHV